MKNLVIVSFPAKEGMLDDLKETLKAALPDTRSFDGCISVDTYIEDSTNTIHLIEDWESLDHQSKYLNWRIETGLLDVLEPLLSGGAGGLKAIVFLIILLSTLVTKKLLVGLDTWGVDTFADESEYGPEAKSTIFNIIIYNSSHNIYYVK